MAKALKQTEEVNNSKLKELLMMHKSKFKKFSMENLANEAHLKEIYEYNDDFKNLLLSKVKLHPDYEKLLVQLELDSIKVKTPGFEHATMKLYKHKVIDHDYYSSFELIYPALKDTIKPQRDYRLTYNGLRYLIDHHLLKIDDRTYETPSYFFLRIAILMSKNNAKEALKIYDFLSQGLYTFSSNFFNTLDSKESNKHLDETEVLLPYSQECLNQFEQDESTSVSMQIPTIFMNRLEKKSFWTLLPEEKKEKLDVCINKDFDKRYRILENTHSTEKKAQEVYQGIVKSVLNPGKKEILFKDNYALKSNFIDRSYQNPLLDKRDLGVKSYISLPQFVITKDGAQSFDFKRFGDVVSNLVEKLNFFIDEFNTDTLITQYRPLLISTHGLHELFFKMNIPYDSKNAILLEELVFETLYYSALRKSCELSKKFEPYNKFKGSLAEKGVLQFDLWKKTPLTSRYNWAKLKNNIRRFGLRNSSFFGDVKDEMLHTLGRFYTLAPMSSMLVDVAGHKMIHPALAQRLEKKDLWSKSLRNKIILTNGSLEGLENIPQKIGKVFKTSFHIAQKSLIQRAASRGKYICQDEKLELSLKQATPKAISALIKLAYQEGLKTAFSKINT